MFSNQYQMNMINQPSNQQMNHQINQHNQMNQQINQNQINQNQMNQFNQPIQQNPNQNQINTNPQFNSSNPQSTQPPQMLDYRSIPKIKVIVRKRPLNKKEIQKNDTDVVDMRDDNKVIVKERKVKVDLTKYIEEHTFIFDEVYNETSTNEQIYLKTVRPMIDAAFHGFKATCFAYGQTGSGKTYTMMGNGTNNPGIYLYSGHDIFNYLNNPAYKGYTIWVSFYEIYCQKLFDLLNKRNELIVREDGSQNICIVGITEKQVYNLEGLMNIILYGLGSRTTGVTGANSDSSRSHAILQIIIKDSYNEEQGKISFIDLAGSERAADVKDTGKQTRIDGAEINKSLLALKECFRALDQAKKHTPFRGSKLTLVIRDSFIGNCKTLMIANISPALGCSEHTLNTLRYADRVKELRAKGNINIGPGNCNLNFNNNNNGPKDQLEIFENELMMPRQHGKTVKYLIDNNNKKIEKKGAKKTGLGGNNGNGTNGNNAKISKMNNKLLKRNSLSALDLIDNNQFFSGNGPLNQLNGTGMFGNYNEGNNFNMRNNCNYNMNNMNMNSNNNFGFFGNNNSNMNMMNNNMNMNPNNMQININNNMNANMNQNMNMNNLNFQNQVNTNTNMNMNISNNQNKNPPILQNQNKINLNQSNQNIFSEPKHISNAPSTPRAQSIISENKENNSYNANSSSVKDTSNPQPNNYYQSYPQTESKSHKETLNVLPNCTYKPTSATNDKNQINQNSLEDLTKKYELLYEKFCTAQKEVLEYHKGHINQLFFCIQEEINAVQDLEKNLDVNEYCDKMLNICKEQERLINDKKNQMNELQNILAQSKQLENQINSITGNKDDRGDVYMMDNSVNCSNVNINTNTGIKEGRNNDANNTMNNSVNNYNDNNMSISMSNINCNNLFNEQNNFNRLDDDSII